MKNRSYDSELLVWCFAKALMDCFPRQDNKLDMERRFRLKMLGKKDREITEAQDSCADWVEANVFSRYPEWLFRSRVIIRVGKEDRLNEHYVSLSDGITEFRFIMFSEHGTIKVYRKTELLH